LANGNRQLEVSGDGWNDDTQLMYLPGTSMATPILRCITPKTPRRITSSSTRKCTRAVTLVQLETDLRVALEQEQLCFFYQPIIGLDSMKLFGFEALVRWNHPKRGLVSPNEFISVSEDTGLIIPLNPLDSAQSLRAYGRVAAQMSVQQRVSSQRQSLGQTFRSKRFGRTG
jgi:predicted signal transduction protein with EAL and GGDEF domain